MLDTNTKRRIDTARDILVGEVPDPKSQVEQITIALIYKFMDDMDAESEEFGVHETRNLYEEVLKKMPENGNIEKKIQATLVRVWGEENQTAEPVILQ